MRYTSSTPNYIWESHHYLLWLSLCFLFRVAVVEPEDQEPVDEPKPKRNRKKKGGSKERASSAPGEEEKAAVPAPASPAPASPVAKPSPAKPKKEVPVESPPEPGETLLIFSYVFPNQRKFIRTKIDDPYELTALSRNQWLKSISILKVIPWIC